MERLTVRSKIGTAFFDSDGTLIRGAGGSYNPKATIPPEFIRKRLDALDETIDRLAAYEDSGLTPEEVAEFVRRGGAHRHAHVIVDWLGNCTCSGCKCRGVDSSMPYCANCGARLDEPEEREE